MGNRPNLLQRLLGEDLKPAQRSLAGRRQVAGAALEYLEIYLDASQRLPSPRVQFARDPRTFPLKFLHDAVARPTAGINCRPINCGPKESIRRKEFMKPDVLLPYSRQHVRPGSHFLELP